MTTFGQIPSNDELITGTNVTLGGLNLASLYPDPGVDKPASLKVTQRGAGVNMSVDVAAGSAYVPDGSNGINLISKAAVTNLAVSNGDAGGIRHDFVTVDSSGTLAVLEGTVGSDPTPASNTHVLARIRVPQNETTSIDDADIDDKREYATVFRKPKGFIAEDAATSDQNLSGTEAVVDTITFTAEVDRRYRARWTLEVRGTSNSRNQLRLRKGNGTGGELLVSLLTWHGETGAAGQYGSTLITPIFTYTAAGSKDLSGTGREVEGTDGIYISGDALLSVDDVGGLDKPTGSEGQ